MSRPHMWSYYCEVCHSPDRKDSPILAMHHGDGAILICMNCYLREIDRGKAHVAVAQRDIVGNTQRWRFVKIINSSDISQRANALMECCSSAAPHSSSPWSSRERVVIGWGWLRSWVQLPPGPFLSVLEIRYWIELDFDNCRTKTVAIIEYELSFW